MMYVVIYILCRFFPSLCSKWHDFVWQWAGANLCENSNQSCPLTIRGWCFSQNLGQFNCIRFSDWFLRLYATVLHLQVEKNDVRSSLLLFCDMNLKNTVKHISYCPQQTIHPFATYQSPHYAINILEFKAMTLISVTNDTCSRESPIKFWIPL